MSNTPLADSQILTSITSQYLTATTSSMHVMFLAAQSIFAGFVVLQLAWSAFKVTIKSDRVEDLQSEILWQMIITGIFYFIVLNCAWLIPQIVHIFIQIAGAAEPISSLDPSAIAAQGLQISGTILKSFGVGGFLTDIPGAVITIVATIAIAILFGLIAVDLMVTLILNYFQIALAPLFIAFGTFEYIRDIGHSYIKSSIALAVKLFILYLVIGIGQSMASTWSAQASEASNNYDVMSTLAILVGSLAFWRISQILPSHFAGIIHSSHVSTGGTGAALVGGAIAGATTAASLASGGTAAVAGAAIRTSVAATKLDAMTADHMKSGNGFASAAMKTFSSAAKAGAGSLMSSATQGSSFLKNLDSARDQARPPQPSKPAAAGPSPAPTASAPSATTTGASTPAASAASSSSAASAPSAPSTPAAPPSKPSP